MRAKPDKRRLSRKVVLTERDFELLDALWRFGILTRSQMQTYFDWGCVSDINRRLHGLGSDRLPRAHHSEDNHRHPASHRHTGFLQIAPEQHPTVCRVRGRPLADRKGQNTVQLPASQRESGVDPHARTLGRPLWFRDSWLYGAGLERDSASSSSPARPANATNAGAGPYMTQMD